MKKIEMDYFNEKYMLKKTTSLAWFWGTVHINVDGTLFPCLAVDMGNVKDGLSKVIHGDKFKKFKEIISKEGTVHVVTVWLVEAIRLNPMNLITKAKEIRELIIKTIFNSKSGHIGGSLSV